MLQYNSDLTTTEEAYYSSDIEEVEREMEREMERELEEGEIEEGEIEGEVVELPFEIKLSQLISSMYISENIIRIAAEHFYNVYSYIPIPFCTSTSSPQVRRESDGIIAIILDTINPSNGEIQMRWDSEHQLLKLVVLYYEDGINRYYVNVITEDIARCILRNIIENRIIIFDRLGTLIEI